MDTSWDHIRGHEYAKYIDDISYHQAASLKDHILSLNID